IALPLRSPLFPYTTLFRSKKSACSVGLPARKCPTFSGQFFQQRCRLPPLAAACVQLANRRQYLVQADAVGIEHRPTAPSGEAIAVQVDEVDIAGALGDALFEDLCALVDQRVDGAFDDVPLFQLATLDALLARGGGKHRRQLGVFQRRAVARLVAVVSDTGLLPEHAGGAEAVGH